MFVHVALSGTFDSFLYFSDALGEVNWYNTYIETPPLPPQNDNDKSPIVVS